jgi:hypothetical protein
MENNLIFFKIPDFVGTFCLKKVDSGIFSSRVLTEFLAKQTKHSVSNKILETQSESLKK